MHVTNRSLNLEPVARGIAEHLGWTASNFVSRGYAPSGEYASKWILLTEDVDFTRRTNLARLVSGWTPGSPLLWTDDFAEFVARGAVVIRTSPPGGGLMLFTPRVR